MMTEPPILRRITLGDESRLKLLVGVDTLANAVKVTLGPRGRNVVIERKQDSPIITKDGVTVAKAINLRQPMANLGAQLIKEAASRTADVAGDGTTTATVLAQKIFTEGIRQLTSGASADDLKRGIDTGVSAVVAELQKMSIPVTTQEEISQVGTISANGETAIGELISQAIEKVGRDGIITVEEAKGYKTSLSFTEGMSIDRGYLSPYFVTNSERMVADLQDPLILVSNLKFTALRDLIPLLESVVQAGRSLLIIADEVDGDAMQGLVLNKSKGAIEVCAVSAPSFGEERLRELEDVATFLGCSVLSVASGRKVAEIQLSDLGTCSRVIVSRFQTIMVAGDSRNRQAIDARCDGIREEIARIGIEDAQKENLKMRLAKLSGGVAVLRVGGTTEIELRERKDRVDDALNATRAAIAEGILPGGGTALVQSSRVLKDLARKATGDVRAGIEIVARSCEEPLKQIVRNAGGSPDVVLAKVKKGKKNFGYDARLGEYKDLVSAGILDPVKVVRTALENASSASGMMLTVGAVMVDDDSSTAAYASTE